MANSNNNPTTVQWSGVSSKSLNSAARVNSDTIAIHADAIGAAVQVTVDNSGTPTSCSSALTCREIADCDRRRVSAACVNDPASAAA